MSKTPYEVRLELLKLANEILATPVHNNRDAALQQWHAERDRRPGAAVDFPAMPTWPTAEQVVNKAEELRQFVDRQ